jgi:L-lactate utilization protein LutB
MSSERIEELEKQIAQLESRWPAHSVPPAMLEQLEDLEEKLARELEKASKEQEETTANGHAEP